MNKLLYTTLLFFHVFVLFPLSISSQDKLVSESWYTYESEDDFKGYMHFQIMQDNDLYYIATQARVKTDDGIIIFDMKSTNLKDKYLTIKDFSFHTNGEGGDRMYRINGIVDRVGDSLVWNVSGEGGLREITKVTEYPTVDFFSMFFLLTKLDYSKKGRILLFNSMETDELNYKKNHYVDYLEDEVLTIKGKKINTKKLIIDGDGIGESTYWIDEKNDLVKAAIDNYKIMTKCNKEDIDFDLYELSPSIN